MPTAEERRQQAQAIAEEYGITDEDLGRLEEAFAGKSLRDELQTTKAQLKEAQSRVAELEPLEREPKVAEAFQKAGVDLDKLTRLERKQVLAFAEYEDEEKLRSFIEDNELPTSTSTEETESPAAAEVDDFGRQHGRRPGNQAGSRITPDDFAGWSMEKKVAFLDKHPEEAEQLKRGEQVVVGASS